MVALYMIALLSSLPIQSKSIFLTYYYIYKPYNFPRYFFCGGGSTIKMYSVTTGEYARLLLAHTDNVIGTAINPSNPFQVILNEILVTYFKCTKPS